MKNYSKSMRRKVFCSLSQELALFTSLQHIICSISQSQLFSLSYCHTHSTTVYHMLHLTRCQCAHACVLCLMVLVLHCFFCFHLDVSGCYMINLPLVELCKYHCTVYALIPHLHLVLTCEHFSFLAV